MKITLSCPHARHGEMMRVMCDKTNGLCVHQYFKRCKGWWDLTEHAAQCPARQREGNAVR